MEFGITGLQGKKLGYWDYTLFEIGITEIRSEFGIYMGFHTKQNWDYRMLICKILASLCKEIGIMGLHPI